MKKKTALIIGLISIASLAQARIAETIEACDKRYGKRLDTNIESKEQRDGIITYSMNDLTITIFFRNGYAEIIRYSPGKLHRVDYDTAVYLKNLNGRDKKWDLLTRLEIKTYREDDPRRYAEIRKVDPVLWDSKDGLMHASFSTSEGSLEVRIATIQDELVKGL